MLEQKADAMIKSNMSIGSFFIIHLLFTLSYAIAASMQDIPSFLSISATLLNEKFVLPERIRLTYCSATIRKKGISSPTLSYFLLTIKFLKSKPIVPLLWKSL